MLRLFGILTLILGILSCRTTYREGMNEWLGASRSEWVSVWGYPQHRDVVEAGKETVVYSHRSATCVVSVTFVRDVLTLWRTRGQNCPRGRRPGTG